MGNRSLLGIVSLLLVVGLLLLPQLGTLEGSLRSIGDAIKTSQQKHTIFQHEQTQP